MLNFLQLENTTDFLKSYPPLLGALNRGAGIQGEADLSICHSPDSSPLGNLRRFRKSVRYSSSYYRYL